MEDTWYKDGKRQFTKETVNEYFEKPPNYNRNEFRYLKEILEKYDVRRMVEIGVFKGALTKFIMDNCQDISSYYAIDPWRYSKSSDAKMNNYYAQLDNSQWDQAAIDVYQIMQEYPDRLSVIRLLSIDAMSLFPNEFFDCVFIDADHSYEGALQDILIWSPKVKKRKLICGDDIDRMSVRNAVRVATKKAGIKYIERYKGYWIATV